MMNNFNLSNPQHSHQMNIQAFLTELDEAAREDNYNSLKNSAGNIHFSQNGAGTNPTSTPQLNSMSNFYDLLNPNFDPENLARLQVDRRGQPTVSSKSSSSSRRDPKEEDHPYRDYSGQKVADEEKNICTKGGVKVPFPVKLYNMLEHIDLHEPELANIVSWQPHGRAFVAHDPKRFEKEVLPRFFDQKYWASFRRQLNLWGFRRLAQSGPDNGAYYNELFLRSKTFLCRSISRTTPGSSNGSRIKANPDTEPKFYTMHPLPPSSATPATVSENGSEEVTSKKSNNVKNEEDITSFEPLPLTAGLKQETRNSVADHALNHHHPALDNMNPSIQAQLLNNMNYMGVDFSSSNPYMNMMNSFQNYPQDNLNHLDGMDAFAAPRQRTLSTHEKQLLADFLKEEQTLDEMERIPINSNQGQLTNDLKNYQQAKEELEKLSAMVSMLH
ncbi:hypothetical protein CTEN210_00193 [Chaetoceros tenuissimus]|uniref:HSF-type DNA-binding domain-containing protein n=1 Tax=Chaetoceros tenuissimus TaxID=426638 RepID=A0AAD3CEP8_9STRA|nr:hypothetical protein CTEN210_00193 [Chaetoceros tenuissimus]